LMKLGLPSWRFDSSQVGSHFFNTIMASMTFSTSGGGLPYDLISSKSVRQR
jgi:hypothetical protein